MTFPVPSGERRRIFWAALCVMAFLGAFAFVVAMLGFSFVKPAGAQAAVIAIPMSNSGFSTCAGGTCIWGSLTNSHIRQVPQPLSDEDVKAQQEHDKKWVAECEPKPVRDRYGVMRFTYNAPGCEFGSHPVK